MIIMIIIIIITIIILKFIEINGNYNICSKQIYQLNNENINISNSNNHLKGKINMMSFVNLLISY